MVVAHYRSDDRYVAPAPGYCIRRALLFFTQTHFVMQRLLFVLIALVFCLQACSKQDYYLNTQNEINTTIDKIYQATLDHDAKTVYYYMAEDFKNIYSYDEFKIYFNDYYDVFLEYIIRQRNHLKTRPFEIYAYSKDDPCGFLRMKYHSNETWTFEKAPDIYTARAIDNYKDNFKQKIQSQAFAQMISDYAEKHPEIKPATIREIKRTLLDADLLDIQFYGHKTVITFSNIAKASLLCTSTTWEIKHIKDLSAADDLND